MSAYFNGKSVNLNYIFNNNAYTNTVTGNAKVVLDDITEGQSITVTVLMGENVIPKTDLHVYSTNPSEYISYVTDDNGRAVVRGMSTITIIDAISEEYTVKAEYTKSISESFNSIKKNVNTVGAIKGKASGVSAVAIKDVFEVEHDVKVKISSNNIPLIEDPKIKVFESNLLDKSIFYLVNCTWIDKENGVLKANANNKNYCELASNEEELMDMLEVLNGQTLTLSVESNIPSDLRMAFGVLYEDNTTNEFRGSFGSNVLTTVFDLFYKDDKKIKRLFIRPLYGGDTKFTDTTTVFKEFKL